MNNTTKEEREIMINYSKDEVKNILNMVEEIEARYNALDDEIIYRLEDEFEFEDKPSYLINSLDIVMDNCIIVLNGMQYEETEDEEIEDEED